MYVTWWISVDSMRRRRNGVYFENNIFKCISFHENVWNGIKCHRNVFPMVQLTTNLHWFIKLLRILITRSHWVNGVFDTLAMIVVLVGLINSSLQLYWEPQAIDREAEMEHYMKVLSNRFNETYDCQWNSMRKIRQSNHRKSIFYNISPHRK